MHLEPLFLELYVTVNGVLRAAARFCSSTYFSAQKSITQAQAWAQDPSIPQCRKKKAELCLSGVRGLAAGKALVGQGRAPMAAYSKKPWTKATTSPISDTTHTSPANRIPTIFGPK